MSCCCLRRRYSAWNSHRDHHNHNHNHYPYRGHGSEFHSTRRPAAGSSLELCAARNRQRSRVSLSLAVFLVASCISLFHQQPSMQSICAIPSCQFRGPQSCSLFSCWFEISLCCPTASHCFSSTPSFDSHKLILCRKRWR